MVKVICKYRNPCAIVDAAVQSRLRSWQGGDDDLAELSVGQIHDVMAIEFKAVDGVWLYLETSAPGLFPSPYPSEYFDIVDDKIVSGWAINLNARSGSGSFQRVSFPEWAKDDFFYERLISFDEKALLEYGRWSH